MKCVFEVMSKPLLSEPPEHKYNRLMSLLESLDQPWGISPDLNMPFPGFGTEFTATINLNKLLGIGIKMEVFFRYRNNLNDHHSEDDRIYIEFESKKIDYEYLVLSLFPQIIKCFDAYAADIFDKQLIFKDYEEKRFGNRRKIVNRFYPVSFYSKQICDSFFKRSPNKIAETLSGKIYKAEVFNDGILIIADTKPYSVEDAIEFENKMKGLLRY